MRQAARRARPDTRAGCSSPDGRAHPGLALALVAVASFSLTLPTTQVAVRDLGPVFSTAGRAVAASVLAAVYLLMRRARLPGRGELPGLAVVGLGCVIAFPFLTSVALQRQTSSHGAVIVGLLPAATAVYGAARTRERPGLAFWGACAAGAAAVTAMSIAGGGGVPARDDLLTALAVAAAAVAYAEGARLSRALGSDRVICWALIVTSPLTVPALAFEVARTPPTAAADAWACFAYTAAVSMLLGFFAWYRALELGGVARISQVQLVQPLLTVAAAALLFGETVSTDVVVAAIAVLACVAVAQRARIRPTADVLVSSGRAAPQIRQAHVARPGPSS